MLFHFISCYFYDFIKCFNVSLHLGLLHWNGSMILERILVWRFMVLCCQNGSWCGCIARRIWNYHIWYSENWLMGSVYVMLQTLSIDILFMWVLWWKSLKPRGRHSDVDVWGWSYPWVLVPKDKLVLPLGMSPKRHGVWLALGWCPKIVINWSSILWSIDIWCVDWWGLAVYQLWKDGWGKAKMKPAKTCIHVIKRLIQGF